MTTENIMWLIAGFGAGLTVSALAVGFWLYDIFKDDIFGADGVNDEQVDPYLAEEARKIRVP